MKQRDRRLPYEAILGLSIFADVSRRRRYRCRGSGIIAIFRARPAWNLESRERLTRMFASLRESRV